MKNLTARLLGWLRAVIIPLADHISRPEDHYEDGRKSGYLDGFYDGQGIAGVFVCEPCKAKLGGLLQKLADDCGEPRAAAAREKWLGLRAAGESR